MAYWHNQVIPNMMSREFLSFDLFLNGEFFEHVDVTPTLRSIRNEETSVYFETTDSIMWYDMQNGAYLYGFKHPFPDDNRPNIQYNNLAKILVETGSGGMYSMLPFYFQHKLIESYQYTFLKTERLDSIRIAYYTEKINSWVIDTEKRDTIPRVDSMTIVVNRQNAWIEQIQIKNYRQTLNCYVKDLIVDTPMDIQSQIKYYKYRYNHFNKYNFISDYPPNLIAIFDETHEYKQTLLDCPLISCSGDTTTIAKTTGWKLLDFWHYGCRPCFANLQKYQQEKQENGMRTLENHGITLMCINERSAVTKKFLEVAVQYDASDILYAAQGIERHINIYATPFYVLISPDNTVVARMYDCGKGYVSILNAMLEYNDIHSDTR